MKSTKIISLCFGLLTTSLLGNAQVNKALYLDNSVPIEKRVEDALSKMSTEEKIKMIHAQSKFSSPGVARLGIPDVWMTDGPHGIRPEVLWDEWEQAGWTNDSCTAFPALTCLAAAWNEDISYLYGKSIGEEARYRNKTVLLGPGVNIYRTPLNGRNFEYMGEDPFLASKMVVPYIQGVQSNGVAACVKHYALNNQEVNRNTTNVIVDDRTLREIYLPAFKAAVIDGKAWAIMGSYNLYKNQHCCHNEHLLNNILKNEWGFDGVVVSDWGGVHDTKQSITNGLDMEFGTGTNGLSTGSLNAYDNYYMAFPYLKMIKSGEVGTKELDDKVRRVLRLIFRTTMKGNSTYGSMVSKEHIDAARKIGEEGIVLLKNKNNLLPLNITSAKKIAIIGENAIKMMTVGGGSSSLKVKYEISPLTGIINKIGDKVKIVYARGYVGDPGGEYNGVKSGQNLKDSRSPQELIDEAVSVAKDADYVIFVGGLNKSNYQDCEGVDRKSLDLPYLQNELIDALVKCNKNLIVVNISGNAVSMPWIDKVPSVLQAWYLGTEAGNAIANVLTGEVNPSGKLPFTFPKTITDVGAHKLGDYPGVKRENENIYDEKYNEGIFVGYRWSEKNKIKPLFAFGHGLSYTTFSMSDFTQSAKFIGSNDKITFTVNVQNIGNNAGSEVVQLYISDVKSSLPRPVKELKGFKKIFLNSGESKNVSFTIGENELSFYDDKKGEWRAETGEFIAYIGNSSDNILGKLKFELKK